MPTYSYQCRKCDHVFDRFHGINAKPRVKCPECGGGCKRLLGAGAGVIFKGSGFYQTDYKGNGPTADAKDGSKPAKKEKAETTETSTTDKAAKSKGPTDPA